MSGRLVSCLCLALVAVALGACQETDPSKPATWIAKLSDKDPKVVADALDNLRKMKAKEAVSQIVPALHSDDGKVREAAAAALEDLGDASVVQPLMDAVDLSTSDKAVAGANLKIADALGTIGDKKATPALLKMLKSRDDLLRVKAEEALDKLKDPAAIPALIAILDDDRSAPLVTRWAIMVLGDLRAKEAIPELLKDLVFERPGISFFVESGYALFQIGPPAVPGLIGIMTGTDKDYAQWATLAGRTPAAYVSKAAIVLADIGDPSAVPALVQTLKWKDPHDSDALTNLVRSSAADALGRLRAVDGAAPLAAGLPSLEDTKARGSYVVALAHIDDKKVLPKLEAVVKNAKEALPARRETLKGIALFGDGKEQPLFEALQKEATGDKALKECVDAAGDETDDAKQATCKKAAEDFSKTISDQIAQLVSADACHQDVSCWAGKLKDPSAKIRERAAFELGKIGTPAVVEPLLGACKDDATTVRRAAYIALDWLTRVDATKAALKAKESVLEGQLVAEKSSATFQIVNEDLKRVVWKVKQL
jgi:HEAT repeat protein